MDDPGTGIEPADVHRFGAYANNSNTISSTSKRGTIAVL
jgi:hypothetical protein